MSVREHWINVRVNPEELARIREKQKELGIRNTGCRSLSGSPMENGRRERITRRKNRSGMKSARP